MSVIVRFLKVRNNAWLIKRKHKSAISTYLNLFKFRRFNFNFIIAVLIHTLHLFCFFFFPTIELEKLFNFRSRSRLWCIRRSYFLDLWKSFNVSLCLLFNWFNNCNWFWFWLWNFRLFFFQFLCFSLVCFQLSFLLSFLLFSFFFLFFFNSVFFSLLPVIIHDLVKIFYSLIIFVKFKSFN